MRRGLAAWGRDDRAVSTGVGYVLSLAITALLISGLLIAAGGFLTDQRERVAREELTVIGERVAAGLLDVDRLADVEGEDAEVQVRVELPEYVVGSTYSIKLRNTDPADTTPPYSYALYLVSDSLDINRTVPVRLHQDTVESDVAGGDLVLAYVNASADPDGDASKEVILRQEMQIADPIEPALIERTAVVYEDAGSNELSSLVDGESPVTYGVSEPQAIGPKAIDFDGDGITEVPYVDGSGNVKLVDSNGETTTLASGAALEKTRLAVGRWEGSDLSVFYRRDGTNSMYRVTPDSGPTKLFTAEDNGLQAPVGPCDVDGDGIPEFAYVDGSQQLRYFEDPNADEVKISGGSVGQSNGIGAGECGNVDDDPADEIVYVDTSQNLAYIDATGDSKVTLDGTSASKSPVALVDANESDTAREIVYLDASTAELRIADGFVDGTAETSLLQDTDSSVVAEEEAGAA